MQKTYLTQSFISNRQILFVHKDNAFCKFHTFFRFCLPRIETKNKIRCIDAPKYAFTQKSTRIWKVYLNYSILKSLDSFILALRDNWVSCNQTLGCLRLYGDSRVSRAQSRINAYEILLQHDWLLFFSRHNRFAETHSHLQLSYHITDRLLAAGNYISIISFLINCN